MRKWKFSLDLAPAGALPCPWKVSHLTVVRLGGELAEAEVVRHGAARLLFR